MAEIAKIIFNYLGVMVTILGIFANLNNIVSVTIGFVSIAFICIKILTAYENYLIKRMDRKDRQQEKKYKADDDI